MRSKTLHHLSVWLSALASSVGAQSTTADLAACQRGESHIFQCQCDGGRVYCFNGVTTVECSTTGNSGNYDCGGCGGVILPYCVQGMTSMAASTRDSATSASWTTGQQTSVAGTTTPRTTGARTSAIGTTAPLAPATTALRTSAVGTTAPLPGSTTAPSAAGTTAPSSGATTGSRASAAGTTFSLSGATTGAVSDATTDSRTSAAGTTAAPQTSAVGVVTSTATAPGTSAAAAVSAQTITAMAEPTTSALGATTMATLTGLTTGAQPPGTSAPTAATSLATSATADTLSTSRDVTSSAAGTTTGRPAASGTSGSSAELSTASPCCSDDVFAIDDGFGRPIFEVASDSPSCTCFGLSQLAGGMRVGVSGNTVRSVRVINVPVGASEPTTGVVGTVQRPFSWGVTYTDAAKLVVTASPSTLSNSTAVYVMSVSEVTVAGAVLRVQRMDVFGGGWDDAALGATVTATELP